jgi:hypothetical protein
MLPPCYRGEPLVPQQMPRSGLYKLLESPVLAFELEARLTLVGPLSTSQGAR